MFDVEWHFIHISIACGRRGWRKGCSALRCWIRTWISARSSSNVASRSLDSDILLDTHWLINRQDDRCIVKALFYVVSLFLALSPDCDWFELVGAEFELIPPQLWCLNTSIFTWVCLNDPIQPRWLKFASLCLGSDSNLFEPAFRRQAWKFSASANSKWCSRQFQRLDKFETISQIRGFGQLKSRRGQIQGFDKFETMHQTNSGHRQIGNDVSDKFGAWKCGGDGMVGELCPDMELEKIGLKPVSLFLRFLIYGFFLNFE